MTVSSMKIGIYDPYLDDLGGGEKYMMTIAECLSQDHEVFLFWDNEQDLEAIKKRFLLNLEKVKLVKNIFSRSQYTPFFEKFSTTQQYDCIIFLSDGSVPITLSKKLLLHIQQPLESLAKLSFSDKLKLKKVNSIFYNSRFTKSYNDKLFSGAKSTVVYPPVEIKNKDIKKENIILHVGRFRPQHNGTDDYKKQTMMVSVFKKMVDEKMVNNWKLFIAASVKKDDEKTFHLLQKSAQTYPITFFINKTNNELWDLYSKAKIYWHASGFGEDLAKQPSLAEHFGISTVEAMGAGAVPVVLNAGGQTEIVKNNENGLVWNTVEELKEKTRSLILNETLLKKLSDQAMIRAKDFSKEKFSQAIKKLVSE